MNTKVLLAVFKRNFLAYFTSPTGYVFILRLRAAQFGGRLLVDRVFQPQPGEPSTS